MKKLVDRINNTTFDVASGPVILILLGLPIFIIIVVIGLIILTVKLIKNARQENAEAKAFEAQQENNPEDKVQ